MSEMVLPEQNRGYFVIEENTADYQQSYLIGQSSPSFCHLESEKLEAGSEAWSRRLELVSCFTKQTKDRNGSELIHTQDSLHIEYRN